MAVIKVNVGDTWKDVSKVIKINIGDTWKNVSAAYINIGDTWKNLKSLTVNNQIDQLTYNQQFNLTGVTSLSMPVDFTFKTDGTKLYIIEAAGYSTYYAYQFNLSTAWDISTISYYNRLNVNTNANGADGLQFKSDGSVMYIWDSPSLWVYNLGTSWDVTTGTYSTGYTHSAARNFTFGKNGERLYYLIDYGSIGGITQYNLSTAWNISTTSYIGEFGLTTNGNVPVDISFNSDGTIMYWANGTTDVILEYNLSTAWEISTATYNKSTSFSTNISYFQTILNNGELELFIADSKIIKRYK